MAGDFGPRPFCRTVDISSVLPHCRYLVRFVALSLSRPFCRTVTISSTLSHCHYLNHFVALSLSRPFFRTVDISSTLSHCHYLDHFVALSLSRSFCRTVAISSVLSHCRYLVRFIVRWFSVRFLALSLSRKPNGRGPKLATIQLCCLTVYGVGLVFRQNIHGAWIYVCYTV